MRQVTFCILALAVIGSLTLAIASLLSPPTFVRKDKELSGAAFTAALKEVNAQIEGFKPVTAEECERARMLHEKRKFLKEYCYLPDEETLDRYVYPGGSGRGFEGWINIMTHQHQAMIRDFQLAR